jgi:hydroxymethylpyrimidine/phosphomethylpyrimidine kinase
VALTIAGSDSGGGAGIQADLKTFAALGVHGTSVVTCVTAQNPRGVRAIESCRPEMVHAQLEAVFEGFNLAAVKTGMLYSAEIVRVVADFLRKKTVPLVVDPVMVATSGAQLLNPTAVKILERELLPLATLVTPNLDETAVLLGARVKSPEDMRRAARELHARFGCAVVVKGGHLRGTKEAVDFYCDGRQELLLSATYVKGIKTHGTGCTFSAAIAANVAKGMQFQEAVIEAKEHLTRAIVHNQSAAGNAVLENFWRGR